jgi:glutamate/aspartate transport system permease protein
MLAAYAWRWEVLLEPVPAGGGTYLDWIVAGVRTTALLSLVSWFLALALGTFMGVLRTVPGRLPRLLAAAYVELFRNVPLLVQLFIWYFVVPELVPARLGLWFKARDPFLQQLAAATLCLAFFTGARICEQVRAGIESLARGQRAAALALGLTLPQAYRHVLLPMAFRIIVPPLTSEILNLFKNSAVASTIGLLELAAMGRQLVDYTAQPYESFIAVTVLYVALNAIVLGVMRWIEDRARVPGFIGAGGRGP